MDNTKVKAVEDAEYRQALQYYVDLLADNFTEISEGNTEDTDTDTEDIYEMLFYGLNLLREHTIDDTLYTREAELMN